MRSSLPVTVEHYGASNENAHPELETYSPSLRVTTDTNSDGPVPPELVAERILLGEATRHKVCGERLILAIGNADALASKETSIN
jgi:hypothetical protein